MTSTPSSETAAVGGQTPGPWRVHPWSKAEAEIRATVSGKAVHVAGFATNDDAALIVRAVNRHAIYEQALKRIERVLGGASNGTIEHEAALCARAALASAEAQP